MRKSLLLLLSIALLLVSCKKDNEGLRPNAQVAITGIHSPTKAGAEAATGIMGTDITDSLAFVTKYTNGVRFRSLDGTIEWQSPSFAMFEDNYYKHRDLVNNKLLYQGHHVIGTDGNLGYFIVDCQDACFYVNIDKKGDVIHPLDEAKILSDFAGYDTVAYVPNAVLNKARAEITAAFNRKDYATCYELFDKAFVFVPTTGEKWRAMKAAGIE